MAQTESFSFKKSAMSPMPITEIDEVEVRSLVPMPILHVTLIFWNSFPSYQEN